MSIRTAGEQAAKRDDRRQKWDRRFMTIAEQVATWSKDPGHKVGAVLVRDNVVIATGYNGMPRQMADTATSRDEKLSRTIHAEMNALLNALRQGVQIADCTVYVTTLPICERCAVHLIQAGVRRAVQRLSQPLTAHAGASEIEWSQSGARALRYMDQAGVCVDFLDLTIGQAVQLEMLAHGADA